MNDHLIRLAVELQQINFKPLFGRGFSGDNLVVYISYTSKYKIGYRIVNDVPADIEYFVAKSCGRMVLILWKVNTIGVNSDGGHLYL